LRRVAAIAVRCPDQADGAEQHVIGGLRRGGGVVAHAPSSSAGGSAARRNNQRCAPLNAPLSGANRSTQGDVPETGQKFWRNRGGAMKAWCQIGESGAKVTHEPGSV